MVESRVYLHPSRSVIESFGDAGWNTPGYLLAIVQSELQVIKTAVALLAVSSVAKRSVLSNISVTYSDDDDTLAVIGVLDNTFEEMKEELKRRLDLSKFEYSAVFSPDGAMLLTKTPATEDLMIPKVVIESFVNPLEFESLGVEAPDDIFKYSL